MARINELYEKIAAQIRAQLARGPVFDAATQAQRAVEFLHALHDASAATEAA